MSARVFVGNLSFQTTKEELTQLLSAAGEIVDCHLPTDRFSGQPRGFAFVEFSTEEQANAAIEKFNGQELGGRQLRVNAAEERPAGGGGRGGGGGGPREGGGGGFSRDGGFNRGGPGGGKPFKNKGSRRGLRGRKRSL